MDALGGEAALSGHEEEQTAFSSCPGVRISPDEPLEAAQIHPLPSPFLSWREKDQH